MKLCLHARNNNSITGGGKHPNKAYYFLIIITMKVNTYSLATPLNCFFSKFQLINYSRRLCILFSYLKECP